MTAATVLAPPGHLAAEALDAQLGDPEDAGNPFGFAAAVDRDDRDEFPVEFCARLRDAGFHTNYLPADRGGTFESFDRSLTLVRTVARRDLNVMPGTMFSITATACVRLAGSEAQQQQVAALLRAGGTVAFALSEADHGSDLLANSVRLDPDGSGGYLLSGDKWMVGLGRRCDAVYVVARTGARGPGAFTAVLLDLATLPAGRFTVAAPTRTTGMRGIDFADHRFDSCPVPAGAVVGDVGRALEAAMRAQQIVRVMSTAGSLACADTGLRVALDFAAARHVGRVPVSDLAAPRRDLALASAALMAADLVALAAARGLHVAPEAMSLWACAAKHVVAECVDDLLRRCATVLSTAAVLRGIFQKLQRDAAMVRVIDTSTVANLRSFAGQLPMIAGARRTGDDPPETTLRTVFALDATLPEFDPGRLDLSVRHGDPVTAGYGAVAVSAALLLRARAEPGAAALVEAVANFHVEPGATDPVDLAERFAWLHAAACVVHMWWANRQLSLYGAEPGAAGWLEAVLGYLLARADGVDPRRTASATAALDLISALNADRWLFSAVPVRLAEPTFP